MKIADNSRVVFIGDSITDFGRARPYGEGNGLGTSYVSLVDAMIKAANPAAGLRVINVGTGGDTSRDLKARWETDVTALRPDWLSVLIGINDVWRQFDMPTVPERHVYIDEYEANLDGLLAQTVPALKGGLILMTPYFMETNKSDPMREMMDRYGAVVKKLAEKYNGVFVDLQAAFDRYFAYNHPMAVNWDYIHPNIVGHAIIAREILKALDYQF